MSFVMSKVLWTLVQPSNLLLLLLIIGAILLIVRQRRFGTWLMVGATLGLAGAGLLPLGTWLLVPLENRFQADPEPPADLDGIIVLGGGIDLDVSAARGHPALSDTAERFFTLFELGRKLREAKLVFSGGSGQLIPGALSEADVVRDLAQTQGFPVEHLTLEGRSRNTYENALSTRDLVGPLENTCWILVTSAFHMPRSVGVFRQAGFRVLPYPVDFRTAGRAGPPTRPDVAYRLLLFDLAVRAWVGLGSYWAMGRTSALFPSPIADPGCP